jgi:CheY-like chemotaxis protein
MPAILLVDDDQNTWEAVRLALEPRVTVHVVGSLYAALDFLRRRSHEVCGVIVDLNLTDGTDNFGRVLLERLREMTIPCVVFSSSIRTPADAQRYENEFGVLGTIGKGGAGAEGRYPLKQLRDSVDRMIAVSLGQHRERIQAEIEQELARRGMEIEEQKRRSAELVLEARRVAGKSAATKLAAAESTRIEDLMAREKSIKTKVLEDIQCSGTIEDLERVRTEILHSLGVL